MIALVKLYEKLKTRDGIVREVAGAQPYAIYENGILNQPEGEISEVFPNNGKVFVHESFEAPKIDTFKLFELIESTTFDKSRATSMKYILGKEIYNVNLLEVLDLDETITTDKALIVDKLTKGIYIPFSVSSAILFRTADDFLIGPIQMEFIDGLYMMKDSTLNFVPYYQQEIDIISILDGYKNQERLFSTNQLVEQNIIGWVDVANEQRVISDALKQLKDNMELGELSRKMILRLKEWYGSGRAREPHLQERLHRAIYMFESNTLSAEVVDQFSKLILDLELTQEIIHNETKKAFENEYDTFLKKHEKLIKECERRKQELQAIEERYSQIAQALEIVQSSYISLEQNIQSKIEKLHQNFSDVYAEQLALNAFPNMQSSNIVSKVNNMNGYIQFQSTVGQRLYDFSTFSETLNNNLSCFKGSDDQRVLASIVNAAVLLEEPIIIYGEHCFELAQCIAKTISCEQTISIIPEIDRFSLDELHHQYTNYSSVDDVKSIIIHNPHTTEGLYSLPSYFKHNKWIDAELVPNLIIITIDSLEDAKIFLDQIVHKPLINSADYISRFTNKRTIRSLQAAQTALDLFKNYDVEEYSVSIRRSFREWIEDNEDEDKSIPYQLVEWLNLLNIFLEDEILYKASYTLFKNSLSNKDEHGYGVGV